MNDVDWKSYNLVLKVLKWASFESELFKNTTLHFENNPIMDSILLITYDKEYKGRTMDSSVLNELTNLAINFMKMSLLRANPEQFLDSMLDAYSNYRIINGKRNLISDNNLDYNKRTKTEY